MKHVKDEEITCSSPPCRCWSLASSCLHRQFRADALNAAISAASAAASFGFSNSNDYTCTVIASQSVSSSLSIANAAPDGGAVRARKSYLLSRRAVGNQAGKQGHHVWGLGNKQLSRGRRTCNARTVRGRLQGDGSSREKRGAANQESRAEREG